MEFMRDVITIESMTATVGNMTCSRLLIDVMLRQGTVFHVLDYMMELLEQYKEVLSIQEACCIAVVCICGHPSISFDEGMLFIVA